MKNFEKFKAELDAKASQIKSAAAKPAAEKPPSDPKAKPEEEFIEGMSNGQWEKIHERIGEVLDGLNLHWAMYILAVQLTTQLEALYDESDLCEGAKDMACDLFIDSILNHFTKVYSLLDEENEDEE